MLNQRAFQLAGHTEKLLIAAGMGASRPALVAMAARNQWIDGDALAGLEAAHFRANFLNGSSTLVAHDEGLPHDGRSDATGGEIVDVGSAHSNHIDAQENIARAAQP